MKTQIPSRDTDSIKVSGHRVIEKNNRMDQALQLLKNPSTWCQGANQLVKIGDPEGILPLLETFKMPTEASQVCLLEAMKSLGAVEFAGQLFVREDKAVKINGLLLMELFPDEKHIPVLVKALVMPDERITGQALKSLIAQVRTEKWIDAMLTLLDDDQENVRLAVVNELSWHKSPRVIAGLKGHLKNETSVSVINRIKEIIEE